MKRALLLDFDGVVFKSAYATNVIRKRCELFVQAHTRCNARARELNQVFYKEYGHTLLGLNKHLETKTSLYEFNAFLYDNIDYQDLGANMQDTSFDARLMDQGSCDYDLFVFTNARRDWVYNICSLYGYKLKCEVLDVSDYFLKPQLESYALAEEMISSAKYESILFIDDSPVNITHAPRSWNKILHK